MPKNIRYFDLGLEPYRNAWAIQNHLREMCRTGETDNKLILCEHPPVFTVGKQDCSADWLSTSAEIKEAGIEIVKCNRGGRITYHGPGQLVVYFIVKIADFALGIREFVSKIEDASIRVLDGFGLEPIRKKDYPGIWVDNKKVVAIGLNVAHGVTQHGLAINVEPDLSHYNYIVPCGIKEYGVTSIKSLKGDMASSIEEVKKACIESFSKTFDCVIEKESDQATEKVRLLSSASPEVGSSYAGISSY